MGLPYVPQYCTFDSLGDSYPLSQNTAGTQISSGDKRASVRNAIRRSTCFKISDYNHPSVGHGCAGNYSAFDAIADGDCCHPVVKNALNKLKSIRDDRGSGKDINNEYTLNTLVNRCHTWGDFNLDSRPNKDKAEKERIVRYCANKAADYYNELWDKYVQCRANFSSGNFGEENVTEVCGCMDNTAVNYDPTATTSSGICGQCEYADDVSWNNDTRPDDVVYVEDAPTQYADDTKYPPESDYSQQTSQQQSGRYCYSDCPNPMGRFFLSGYCTTDFPNLAKPACGGKEENLSFDALTARIEELTQVLTQQNTPETATNESEIDSLRSELSYLQDLMAQNQGGGSGYYDTMPEETAQAGLGGGLGLYAIIGGVLLVTLILVMNRRKAPAPQAPIQ